MTTSTVGGVVRVKKKMRRPPLDVERSAGIAKRFMPMLVINVILAMNVLSASLSLRSSTFALVITINVKRGRLDRIHIFRSL